MAVGERRERGRERERNEGERCVREKEESGRIKGEGKTTKGDRRGNYYVIA